MASKFKLRKKPKRNRKNDTVTLKTNASHANSRNILKLQTNEPSKIRTNFPRIEIKFKVISAVFQPYALSLKKIHRSCQPIWNWTGRQLPGASAESESIPSNYCAFHLIPAEFFTGWRREKSRGLISTDFPIGRSCVHLCAHPFFTLQIDRCE